jgi:tetratricopeptide (TPR) repeat protein
MFIERDMGTLLDMTGRMAEGEERLQASLDIGREVYGDDNANILGSLVLLGRAQTRGGRLAAARITLDEALSLAASTIGTEHPNYGRTLIDYGWLELINGEFATAEQMLQDAYRIVSASQGRENSTSINIRYRLAYVPFFEGRYPEALSRFRASIDAISAAFGYDHPFTYGATTFMLAAQVTLDPATLGPMEDLFDSGSTIKDGVFHQRGRLAGFLAESYYLKGDLERASTLISDANRWYDAVSGPEARHYYFDLQLAQAEIDAARGVDVTGALADLGSFLRDSGDRTGVREWTYRTHLARLHASNGDTNGPRACTEAIDRLREIVVAGHPMIARAQTDCAVVALTAQEPGLAADLLAAAAPVLPEVFGEDHWRLAQNEAMIAAAAQRLGRDGDWAARREAAIGKVVQTLGETSPVSETLRSL